MKLFATLETSKGKVVSVSDNEQITATVYDGNMKAYSVIIEWCNVGDNEEPTMGAIVTTREWRNRPQTNEKCATCMSFTNGYCDRCYFKRIKGT
jgi:hypothetical protein